MESTVQVEIWSDVVCPWCAIGRQRFIQALDGFAHADQIDVVWRSFELDPEAPRERLGDPAQHLADKYGTTLRAAREMQDNVTRVAAAAGLEFRFDRARAGNTFDAHRLLHLARDRGLQDVLKQRLFTAYFRDGEAIGDTDTLVRLAAEVGLDAAEARGVVGSDAYAADVRADEAQARAVGITGVPFFVIDRRYGVSGAQSAEILRSALNQAWADAHPDHLVSVAGEGDVCADGSCAV
jgi:predicted DsbA family dithiol-disulfide isomerase